MSKPPKDVLLSPLKKIRVENGDVYHCLKNTDSGYKKFGEAYISTIENRKIKGWKRHKELQSNLIVMHGTVRFVIYSDNLTEAREDEFWSIDLGPDINYQRLTIPSGIWFAFQGRSERLNMILNVASLTHDPDECDQADLEKFKFNWEK